MVTTTRKQPPSFERLIAVAISVVLDHSFPTFKGCGCVFLYQTIVGSKVAIARDNRKGIELYAKSGKLYHERAATRDMIRYIKTKAQCREDRAHKMEEARSGEYRGFTIRKEPR